MSSSDPSTARTPARDVGIVGGAAVPHAPQFFTLPPTEDHDQVARIEAEMGRIGDRLRALEPDVVVIVANDHLENYVLHCVPSFTVHCGVEATGSFAGHDFRWPVASATAGALVEGLQARSFDPAFTLTATIGYEFGIPLTFLGFDTSTPLLPVYVNTYVAPQPHPDRCYAFGRALDGVLAQLGLRAVIIASGGLSHYPGTERYSAPDVGFDEALFARLEAGNLRALVAYDANGLDETGNVEVRSWQILAGALGERTPDRTLLEPSWHHTYGVLGWTTGVPDERPPLHYPPLPPERVELLRALYGLRMEGDARQRFLADPDAYADGFALEPDERKALVGLDEAALRDLRVHPLLGFLARLQVDLSRPTTAQDG